MIGLLALPPGLAVACGSSGPQAVAPPVPSAPPSASAAPVAPSASAAAPATSAVAERHEQAGPPRFSYSGDSGPARWGDLSPEYLACKKGTRQSPIDLVTKEATVDKDVKALEFDYAALPLELLNNGHTVQVNATAESTVRLRDDSYRLVQVDLHSPSEHSVDGKLLEMELDLVHKNDQRGVLVVALLFKQGKENKILAPVFAHAPAEVSQQPKSVANTTLDLAKLMPPRPAFYAYPGSLTTPPCTEGVRWLVLQQVFEVSKEQIAKFRQVTHGDTNRPVQPLGERKLLKNR